MLDRRVLVVGTTRDYIEYIQKKMPGRAVFLTDPSEYPDGIPDKDEEIFQLVHPLDENRSLDLKLEAYLEERDLGISGVACFDCESLLLASELARGRWKFPGAETILNCRDKHRSRILWRSNGVSCPGFTMAMNEGQVRSFADSTSNHVVIKPVALSGSELVYIARNHEEAVMAFRAVIAGLGERIGKTGFDRDGLLEDDAVLCEEFIEGVEYSCDFLVDGDILEIIRIARKHLLPGGASGTVQAYEVGGVQFPVSHPAFRKLLRSAVRSLGLKRAIGMADFIFRGKLPYFLEITPRPGGDCIPQLLRHSSGFDIIGASIDFAEGKMPGIPRPADWRHLVGLRVFSGSEGRLVSVRLRADSIPQTVIEESWMRIPGDRIKLPPKEYKSWLLGHVIFAPIEGIPLEDQILQVRGAVEVVLEQR